MGIGYVGLPTASFLSSKGFNVLGVDTQAEIVDAVNSGRAHIHEPDLQEKMAEGLSTGRLRAAGVPSKADVFIITVPTPVNEDSSPDITCVESAIRMISPFVKPGNLVIIESTSPVGTTELMADIIRAERPDLKVPGFDSSEKNEIDEGQIFISYCPERILPGNMFSELVENDRIIGGIDRPSAETAKSFYSRFVSGLLLTTDSRTAEMSKLAENTFRDVNIAFANELSLICEKLGIDIWEMISLANRHPRVNIHSPGPGVGGHCIPIDPWFIYHSAPDTSRLIRTAREINDSMPSFTFSQIRAACKDVPDPVIAILGLSYKPDIDDLRTSPALEIVKKLIEARAGKLLVVEPFIDRLPDCLEQCSDVSLINDPSEAVNAADVVAILVPHTMFLDINLNGKTAKRHRVIDATGMLRNRD